MLDSAKSAKEIKGRVPHLIEGGITNHQYADDTIFFLNMNDQSIIHTKFLLYCFENMSGLKINYQKSKIFALGIVRFRGIQSGRNNKCMKKIMIGTRIYSRSKIN
jgi:hypothetical protein